LGRSSRALGYLMLSSLGIAAFTFVHGCDEPEFDDCSDPLSSTWPCPGGSASSLWPPEFVGSQGIMINDFDEDERGTYEDKCQDGISRRSQPSTNLLGHCVWCFGDCLGVYGAEIETDVVPKLFRERGRSLKLSFDAREVDRTGRVCEGEGVGGAPPNPDLRYAGYVEPLTDAACSSGSNTGSFDVTALGVRYLTFWWTLAPMPNLSRPSCPTTAGVGVTMDVALQDSAGRQTGPKQLVRWTECEDDCMNGWRKERFELEALTPVEDGTVDLSKLKEISLTFAEQTSGCGAVYVDEIAFER
jgi:hypothetical protein